MTEGGKDGGLSVKDRKAEPKASGKKMYVFDQNKFNEETRRHLGLFSSRNEGLIEAAKDRVKLQAWSEKFSGRVPKYWGEVDAGAPWHVIVGDLENPKVKLTEDEILAAIEYPIWHVPRMLGEKRKLSPKQLKMLALRSLPGGIFDDIVKKQQSDFGLSQRNADDALDSYTRAAIDRL